MRLKFTNDQAIKCYHLSIFDTVRADIGNLADFSNHVTSRLAAPLGYGHDVHVVADIIAGLERT